MRKYRIEIALQGGGTVLAGCSTDDSMDAMAVRREFMNYVRQADASDGGFIDLADWQPGTYKSYVIRWAIVGVTVREGIVRSHPSVLETNEQYGKDAASVDMVSAYPSATANVRAFPAPALTDPADYEAEETDSEVVAI